MTLEGTEKILVLGTRASSEELEVLRIPPKLCTYKQMKVEEFELAFEVGAAKRRWELRNQGAQDDRDLQAEVKDRPISPEEKEVIELEEARPRKVTDLGNNSIDLSKMRCTGM